VTVLALLVAAVVLAVAVIAPQIAGAVAVGAALATVAVLLAGSLAEQRSPVFQPLEPFGPDADGTVPTIETPDVTDLLREIGSGRKDLPPRIISQLRDIAAGRLLDGHRLDLGDPAERRRATALVSDELGTILFDDDDREPPQIAKRRLGPLLDELERL
jgi:hypothetical protein